LEEMLRQELGAAIVSQIGGLLMRRAFARFRQRIDYAEYGAAPLLGLGGLALVGQGRASSRAGGSGVAMAARLGETRTAALGRARAGRGGGERRRAGGRCGAVAHGRSAADGVRRGGLIRPSVAPDCGLC